MILKWIYLSPKSTENHSETRSTKPRQFYALWTNWLSISANLTNKKTSIKNYKN